MQDQLDPVDGALESLKGRTWPGSNDNEETRNKLMQEYQSKRASSRLGRRGMVIAALGILILGGAGFAAAGGVEVVRGWFITVEVNGKVIDLDDADMTIETEGDMTIVTIKDAELDETVEGGTATVTMVGFAPDESRSTDDEVVGDADLSTGEMHEVKVTIGSHSPEEEEGEEE